MTPASTTHIGEFLVDAQEMHLQTPATFDAPTAAKMAAMQPGWLAKVCDGEQRFWTVVKVIDGDKVTAEVNNATGREDRGYGEDQLIVYEKRHMYLLHTPKENARCSFEMMYQLGAIATPTKAQQEKRCLGRHLKKHWAASPDMFEQGAATLEEALMTPIDPEKVRAYFCEPSRLKGTGLTADNFDVAYVMSREELVAKNVMSEPHAESAVKFAANGMIAPKLFCLAYN